MFLHLFLFGLQVTSEPPPVHQLPPKPGATLHTQNPPIKTQPPGPSPGAQSGGSSGSQGTDQNQNKVPSPIESDESCGRQEKSQDQHRLTHEQVSFLCFISAIFSDTISSVEKNFWLS